MATVNSDPHRRYIKNVEVDRRLLAQEKAFHGKLLQIYETSILPLTKGYLPLELIRQRHEKKVKAQIRKAVTDSYFFGITAVDNHIRSHAPDHPTYPTGRDLENIIRNTERQNGHFWKIVNRLYVRDYTIDRPNFDYKSGLQRISIGSVYSSFSDAVRVKYPNSIGTYDPPRLDRSAFSLRGFLADITRGFRRSKVKVRWETAQDSKVCQTGVEPFNCKRHDGEEFDPNDPGLPEVPAHDFCRCRLIPVDEGEGFTEKLKGLIGL